MTVLEINGYGTWGVSEKSTCWTVPETNQERYANRNNTGLIGIKQTLEPEHKLTWIEYWNLVFVIGILAWK
jgi:hypothetical protein